jgi:hypothetical protein
MRQLEALRHRASGNERWFRLGLMSTTVIAPLIARWNDLRATKRNLCLSEESESRFEDLREQAQTQIEHLRSLASRRKKDAAIEPLETIAAILPAEPSDGARPRMRSDNVRVGLWLAGVGLGLVAAGAGAYFIARRRLAVGAEEPLLELPLDQAPRGPGAAGGTGGATREQPARSRSGATVTMDGQDRRTAPRIPDADHDFSPADVVEPGMPTPGVPAGAPTIPSGAAFVGNIHTMVYHAASDTAHLPAEENRVYFASVEEAEEAGYRRDRRPKPPTSEAEISATEGPTA